MTHSRADVELDPPIAAFLRQHGCATWHIGHAIGDASQRRYHRLRSDTGEGPSSGAFRRAILMIDPPPNSSLARFVSMTERFRHLGLTVPALYATASTEGLALLEDFGDRCIASELDRDPADAAALYHLAVDPLLQLAEGQPLERDAAEAQLPIYDRTAFVAQLALLLDHPGLPAGQTLSDAARKRFSILTARLLRPLDDWPTVLIHRDYHVENLMLLSDVPGPSRCGILDFQDAGIGPLGYDLISLLEDARRTVPPAIRRAELHRYWAAFPELSTRAEHITALLAVVRHLRVIAVFNRLADCYGKPKYRDHIPRIKGYLSAHLQVPELAELKQWLGDELGDTWLTEQR